MFLGEETTLGAGTFFGDTVTTPAVDPDTAGSWWALAALLAERAPMVPEVACPNDGEPYRVGARGVMFCPFDGHRPGTAASASVVAVQDWGGLRGVLAANAAHAAARAYTAPMPADPPGWGPS